MKTQLSASQLSDAPLYLSHLVCKLNSWNIPNNCSVFMVLLFAF